MPHLNARRVLVTVEIRRLLTDREDNGGTTDDATSLQPQPSGVQMQMNDP